MNWITLFVIVLSLLTISFSQNEVIRLLGLVAIITFCFFDLEETIIKYKN